MKPPIQYDSLAPAQIPAHRLLISRQSVLLPVSPPPSTTSSLLPSIASTPAQCGAGTCPPSCSKYSVSVGYFSNHSTKTSVRQKFSLVLHVRMAQRFWIARPSNISPWWGWSRSVRASIPFSLPHPSLTLWPPVDSRPAEAADPRPGVPLPPLGGNPKTGWAHGCTSW